MNTQNGQRVMPRGAVTRRVLLAAAGFTLLGGGLTPRSQRVTGVAGARPARARQVRLARSVTTPSAPSVTRHGWSSRPDPGPGPASPRHGRRDGAPVRYVDVGRKAIALTIDDGPDAEYTPQVLRLLAKYGITATFSMIGIQAAAEPAMAREVAQAGHLISNHTWRHLNLGWLAPMAAVAEMDRATEAIHKATGVTPAMFRAPFGVWTPAVLRHCAQTGMMPLGWSVDPRDWSRPGVPAIVDNIMRNTRTGSIILEHDGGGDRSETVAALRIVIPSLLHEGYHFVTP